MPPTPTPAAAYRLEPKRLAVARRLLLRWYRRHRRDLPWRRTRDPYRIWIAEIMLQQTRVEAVVPHYERFLHRFPDMRTLARARLADVLHAWSGLGYYTRARNLHAAARRMVAQDGGRLPQERAALRALPGIGRYTAGAILSQAYARPEPVLDGNVARVFARTLAIDGDLARAALQRALWEIAALWARCRTPGDANQALMELGATLCTPRAPACPRCPLARHCQAHRTGRELELPRPRRRPRTHAVRLAAALLRRGSRLLLVQRRGRLLRDWWEIPTLALRPRSDSVWLGSAARLVASGAGDREWLRRALRTRLGFTPGALRRIGGVSHGILQHRLEVEILSGAAPPARSRPRETGRVHNALGAATARRGRRARRALALGGGANALANLHDADPTPRWVDAAACRGLPLSTLTRKALRAAAAVDPSWSRYLVEKGESRRPGGRR